MALGSILVILPDTRMQPHYWHEFSSEGYSVVMSGSLDEALNQLAQNTYDVIVFDIEDELPGATMNHIAALKRRHKVPLIVQGSPFALGQLLAEFSQHSADKSATLDADALVIKGADVTELQITLKDLLSRRDKFSINGNSAAS